MARRPRAVGLPRRLRRLLTGLVTMGGTVGVGTVVQALAIGPLVQAGLDRLGLPAPEPAGEPAAR